MRPESVDSILDWLAEAGLAGADEAALVRGFSERCIAAGCRLSRGLVIIDTLHPLYEGRALIWEDDPAANLRDNEFQPVRDEDESWENWQRNPFFHMLRDGQVYMRCRLVEGGPLDYPQFEELRLAGQTDYLAVVHRLRDAPSVEDADGFYARWTTAAPQGFSDADIDALKRLTTQLALALRLAAQTRLAGTLVETYLGRDAGRRVLQGGIVRGRVEKISAVLWFSDLTGYTRLSEELPSEQMITLLNDYAEAVIGSVHDAGGDVLKLIGDGVLAIFPGPDLKEASMAAMAAGRALGQKLRNLAERRTAEGLPAANVHLGVHFGDVYYGNIGSPDRLDFTVVGSAVNEVSRIAAMCHSVDRRILCSSEFIELLPEAERSNFVSVGRFALRGVGRARHLYTLDPAMLQYR
ncbi:adenylate/guanylate cyclase domain-containing protein [Kumtagia ephedrae]|uniref:Adenylate/guanylate cyclase domain-containing protein n=1 Tax=Kumtagia ephedrae TaxID=2116701 RepID=A0A2P7RR53_9HYPH|nr:adenylate/guanylate cyclase domain-containing protein [Mesorhizobium ephedrae]PSJ52694.1 adenylate/guanylate cyclase domain-containing protein [Mesorhizobium ephedrae]